MLELIPEADQKLYVNCISNVNAAFGFRRRTYAVCWRTRLGVSFGDQLSDDKSDAGQDCRKLWNSFELQMNGILLHATASH